MWVLYAGQMGNGKTLGMVAKALRIIQKNPSLKVYSNFNIWWHDNLGKRQEAELLTSWKQLTTINNCLVLLDEGHILFDSRDFKNNIEKTHFALQSRHTGLNVMITTQVLDQVDVRIRRVISELVICEKKRAKDGHFFFSYQHLTPSSITSDSFRIGRTEFLHKPELIWNHYNTLELITDLATEPKNDNKRIWRKSSYTSNVSSAREIIANQPELATYPSNTKPIASRERLNYLTRRPAAPS